MEVAREFCPSRDKGQAPEARVQAGGQSKAAKLQRQQPKRPNRIDNSDRELNISHSYNAIKLTNYFTNLLQRRRNQQQQLECSGEQWRAQQLAHQIPHQDIKLLTTTQTTLTTTSQDSRPETGLDECGGQPSVSDEIKFIRGQRKMASQFKASLYYLNPTRTSADDGASKVSGAGGKQSQRESKSTAATKSGRVHNCFKVSLLTPGPSSGLSSFESNGRRIEKWAPKWAPKWALLTLASRTPPGCRQTC